MPSGIIYGEFSGVSPSGVRPAIEWSYTQNTDNNTSSLTAVLVYLRYGYSPSWSSNHPVTFNIDGNSQSLGRPFDIRSKTRDVIWTRTRVLTHNSDGTRTVYLGASGNTEVSLGSYNFGETLTLETIPRASSVSINNLTLGDDLPVSINKAHSSFTHDLSLYFGANGSGTADWLAEWYHTSKTSLSNPTVTIIQSGINRILERMPNTTSATIRIRCRTFNGSTHIGTSYDTATVTIPNTSTYRPSIISLSSSIVGDGRDSDIGKYVQGISKASVSYEYSTPYGTSLSRTQLIIDGIVYGSGSPRTSRVLDNSGTRTISLKLIDRRGREANDSITIYVEPYSNPRISYFEVHRNQGTTSALVEWEMMWGNVGGDNPLSMEIYRYISGSSSGTRIGGGNLDGGISQNYVTDTGLSDSLSYEYVLTIVDTFGRSASAHYTIGTAKAVMTLARDGVGIGKVWERGALDIDGDVYIENSKIQDYLANFFANSSHNHSASNITSGTLSYLRIPRGTTSTTVATGNHTHTISGITDLSNNDLVDSTGSNSNGKYIRFKNGIQICWYNTILTYTSTTTLDNSWTYPMSFSASPTVSGNATESASVPHRSLAMFYSSVTRSSCQINMSRPTGSTNFGTSDTRDVSLIAIGEW